MNEQDRPTIKRILVALDNSPASLAALEAELVGLFVEDINLVRLAELSFSHEIGLYSGSRRRLEIRQVERQFRSQASQARQALEQIAQTTQLACSFRVARGMIAAELLTAAAETDLIILGKVSRLRRGSGRLGSTARSILAQGAQLTLLLQHGVRLGEPILIIYDDSAAAQKAVATVAQLMQGKTGAVTLLVLAAAEELAQQLRQRATGLLANQSLEVRYLWQQAESAHDLARFINQEGFQLVVVPNDGTLDGDTTLSLLDEIDCPVLLVR